MLTVAVIVYSAFGLGAWVIESAVAGQLACGAALNIVAFLFMTCASTANPARV